jgi:alpha-1,6-mannosyltransferase
MPYDPSYHLLYRVDKIVARVRELHPDVLEIHSPYAAAIGALACPRSTFGVRTMQWHSDFIDTYAGTLKDQGAPPALLHAAGLAKAPLWAWVRRIGRGCDAVLTASRWQQEKLSRHGVRNVRLAPFGVDKDVFTPQAGSQARKAELLGHGAAQLGGRKFDTLLLGVGRFAIEKRWDVVLAGMKRFTERGAASPGGPTAKLVLFGDGPERPKLEKLAAGRDDVVILGFEKDRATLASALASADLLVHGCPYETFGLGVSEALCTGLPAVVPNEGGAAEMVDDSCGAHYRTGDPDDLAEKISMVLGRDRAALRQGALARAATLPTVRGEFEARLALYEELLKNRQDR